MLRVASLIRPLLAKQPAMSGACSFPLLRITSDTPVVQPPTLLWKPSTGVRCMMNDPGQQRTISPSVEAALRAQDKITPDYNIIYRAPLQKYITVTYVTTWVSIVTVPLIVGIIFLWDENQSYPYEIGGIPLLESSTDGLLLSGILLLIIANVARTVAKYPFRIYRNPKENKYIAVFQHPLPGMISKKEFLAGDVKKTNDFIWKESCYSIKKKKMLIIPDHFSTPIELERMQIDPKLNDPVEIRKRRSKIV